MEDMPDLSHLTPEERRHIESVMMRQKQEEENQNEIMRRKQNEVQILEDTITRARTERLKNAGVDLDVTCEICLKTKFVDGVGHICNYCNVRCCARCGGKVSLRSNKVIWVCILCRKKQELLSKSGQWIMKANMGGTDGAMLRRMQEDMQGGMLPPGLHVDQSQDKRPKLERAHSAAEKENLPLLQRSGSLLRRQYSHQDQIPGRRLSTSDSGVEMSVSPHSRTLPTPHVAPYQTQQTPRHPAAFPEDDPSIYRGELDGLMRQNASYQRQRQLYQEQNSEIAMAYGHHQLLDQGNNMRVGPMHPSQQQHPPSSQQLHPSHAQGPGGQGQRSFSSSEEERSTPECASDEPDDREHELYDARGNKPSVLVTSPGSPDLYAQGRVGNRQFRHPTVGQQQQQQGNSVGGRLQVKLSFDASTLQLVVTLVCATGLIPRSNGQPRSSYAKMYLLPDRSEKSKKRTKTLANTNEPRWDQTFVYSGVRWTELRQRSLEITVWDYGRYGANDFLGEVIISLAASTLSDEFEWHYLMAHEELRQGGYYQDPNDDIVTTPGDCHLSPPSTTSRLSDSDTSECDITDCDGSREHRRTADGASISSIGSSSRFHNMPPNYKRHYSSPPPEKELCVDGEHRSRRDMSPQGRKRAALMSTREQPASISGYHHYRKVNFRQHSDEPHRAAMLGHRSHSAAPMDSPSLRYRGRSQSPTGHRSLSPPDHRSIPYSSGSGYMTARFGSRSATATPTGSPKKRQLPQIPANLHAALKERVAQDLEERARFIRHRNRPMHTIYRSGMGGWDRRYSGLSDSDLPSMGHEPHSLSHSHIHRMHRSRRGRISPEKDVLADLGDSDMESIGSVTSSAFSTQSERPRGSRGLIDYASQSSSYEKPSRYPIDDGEQRNGSVKRGQFTRSFSNADAPSDDKVDGSLSDTAVGLHVDDGSRRGRKSSPSSKSGSGSGGETGSVCTVKYNSGMGKKSNSTSQLSATECGIVVGSNVILESGHSSTGRKRNSTPSSIQRSQEVMPYHQQQYQQPQQQRLVAPSPIRGQQSSSYASDTAGSLNSISSSEGGSWSPSLRTAGESGQLTEFIEGLGPGQLVGRQVLGAPSLGDIQLSLKNIKGFLEVEVIRARDLQLRPGSKALPAPYVKVYLVSGKKCIAKAKTTVARKTLEPFYQQPLAFRENYKGCILQVTVWGDYGRLEGKKVFMGVAQIMLDNLNLSEVVFGWYKLFGTTSLVSGPPSLGLSRQSSDASLDSLKS